MAFEAAFPCIRATNADRYIFLGDICGYYFDTLVIWEKLVTLPRLVAILGNHDAFFLKCVQQGCVPEQYIQKYGPSLELLLRYPATLVKEKFISWLHSNPSQYTSPEGLLHCVHGSPLDPLDGYMYPNSPLPIGAFAPFVLCGHTHYSMVREQSGTVFFNPGSLGQPRNGEMPTYGVIDTKNKTCSIYHVQYDAKRYAQEIFDTYPEYPYLYSVLVRNK